MALNKKKREPQTPWPFGEQPAEAVPEPYQLVAERTRKKEQEEQAEPAVASPKLAGAAGGPKASFLRQIDDMRKHMSMMPKLSRKPILVPSTSPKKVFVNSQPTSPVSPGPPETEKAEVGSAGTESATPGQGLQLMLRDGPDKMELDIIPEHGPATLMRIEAGGPFAGAIQFPAFEGKGPPHPLLQPPPDAYKSHPANPYWEDASEENKARAEQGNTEKGLHFYEHKTRVSWSGMLVMLLYLGAFGFYLWVRITKTLGLGPYLAYGIVVLAMECLGATTVLLYGFNLLFESVVPEHEAGLIHETQEEARKRILREPYHVRVLVPCYKEPLEILQQTILGALNAALPKGCRKTVYLCDDGKDEEKRQWIESLGTGAQYVSGRKRPVGEMNGKSGNLNSCAAQLYPRGCVVPSSELLCILDADQVAGPDFFLRTIPLFDGGSDVGMVLSPQCFHNLNGSADVFNHGNIHFWEYMQPGYDALGFISCTGTNFLMRSNAFIDVGGSPTYTLTEDYALGMELVKRHWKCRYVCSYLAVGEAPEQIRNAMQQRSRWVKGHFQIMFSRQHCPLLQSKLSIFMRLMYISGVWSYVMGAISTPLFILVPMITIWFGVFPIVISWWMALALTLYFAAMHCVMYKIRKIQHIQALWFANCCNTNLWWVYTKAIYRALVSACGGDGIKFKTTMKGSLILSNSAFRDIWMPILVVAFLLASIIGGIVKMTQSFDFPTPLAISVLWAVYQAVPPFLIIIYTVLTPNSQKLARICWGAMLISFAAGVTAVGLLWHTTYADYNYASVANMSTYFSRASMVGDLPSNYDVKWRSSALLQEKVSGPLSADISGGWLTGGMAGNLKMTMPTAFTTAMLAWGFLNFGSGYKHPNPATNRTEEQIIWGADYLLKMIYTPTPGSFYIVYQVGNYTIDKPFWGRPEDITGERPWYAAPLNVVGRNSSDDLGGAVAAALLAAYVAVPSAPKAASYLSQGLQLYNAVAAGVRTPNILHNYNKVAGLYCGNGSLYFTKCLGDASSLYPVTTHNDFAFWAAAWAFRATGNDSLLADAQEFQAAYIQNEEASGLQTPTVNYGSVYYAANLLLAQATKITSYRALVQEFLHSWMCNTKAGVGALRTTDKGRIWSYADPSLGATANAAFIALGFATLLRPEHDPKARTYTCWATQQLRSMLGDMNGRSMVVGVGTKPPLYAGFESASCPAPPAKCYSDIAEFSLTPNPNVVTGALIFGNYMGSDKILDARGDASNMVAVEYNAGFQGALAGLADYNLNWYQCKVNYGITVTDQTFCSRLKREGGGPPFEAGVIP